MYKDYYQLTDEPFNLTPDPRFLYLTAQHREALNHLLYGIGHSKGFICLTGEVGAGKTLLCRELLRHLDAGRYHTALILNPRLDETELLKAVLRELGISSKRRDRLGYLRLLNKFLLMAHQAGREVVVLIDEAQDMPDATLEMVRLLSNLETETHKLLQIVLVGQPELRDRLALRCWRQLAQRITVRYHLGTMSREDTLAYVQHRITVAGGSGIVAFDAGAIKELHRRSQGTPRLVNAIGDKALLAGYVYQTNRIDKRLVKLAVRELKEAC